MSPYNVDEKTRRVTLRTSAQMLSLRASSTFVTAFYASKYACYYHRADLFRANELFYRKKEVKSRLVADVTTIRRHFEASHMVHLSLSFMSNV